jgi:opacity protein-like surface antigen
MTMRKHIAISVLFAGLLLPFASAQTAPSIPAWELGVGYNYVHANQPPRGCSCFNMNGGTASVAYNFNSKFSLVGEFIGVTNGNVNGSNRNLDLFTYLLEPRYTYRAKSGKLLPYGQVLIGGAHGRGSLYGRENGFSGSSNGFAMTAGGGLDVNLNQHVAIRIFQTDYLLTLLENRVNQRQNNFSLSTGLVFIFGKH